MGIKLFFIFCLFSSSFAWLAPERCRQGNLLSQKTTVGVSTQAGVVRDIQEIADKQHELLQQNYKDYLFPGVPIRAGCTLDSNPNFMYAAHNCTFHTYGPRMLSSVACADDVACKLTHTVSTVDTYSSSEGYNWGVKISSKASFFDKTFEIGGEVSSGGSYTCTYTKGKTTTDTVECSLGNAQSGHLQLYNVKTDMKCNFGKIYLEDDDRDEGRQKNIGRTQPDYLSQSELDEIRNSAAAQFTPCGEIMIDPSKISDRLLQKILNVIPLYNIYTDMIWVTPNNIVVYYFKKTKTTTEYTSIIPFTNEGGDSVFQYACVLTPF